MMQKMNLKTLHKLLLFCASLLNFRQATLEIVKLIVRREILLQKIMDVEGRFPLTILKRHWKTHHLTELVPSLYCNGAKAVMDLIKLFEGAIEPDDIK